MLSVFREQRPFTMGYIDQHPARLQPVLNSEIGVYEYDVKFIPFIMPEGGSVFYGIKLDTQPRHPVVVRPNVTLSNAANSTILVTFAALDLRRN